MIEIRNAHAVLQVEQPATIEIQHVERYWGLKVSIYSPAPEECPPPEECPLATYICDGIWAMDHQQPQQTLFLNTGRLTVETHRPFSSGNVGWRNAQ